MKSQESSEPTLRRVDADRVVRAFNNTGIADYFPAATVRDTIEIIEALGFVVVEAVTE